MILTADEVVLSDASLRAHAIELGLARGKESTWALDASVQAQNLNLLR